MFITSEISDLLLLRPYFLLVFCKDFFRKIWLIGQKKKKKRHIFPQIYKNNSNTTTNSHRIEKIENISNVNFLFKNLFKSHFIYAGFSIKYPYDSLDNFIHLTSHTIFFFPISENLGRSVFKKQLIKKWPLYT